MDFYDYLILVPLLALILLLAVTLPTAIVFNLRAAEKYRQKLAVQLDGLRLGRMLSALGIDIDAYLHRQPIVSIQEQMQKCSTCENTAECEENLESGSTTVDTIDYCKNADSLQDLSKKDSLLSSTQ